MKSFQITSSDLSFLADQVNVPIIEVVRYLLDGTPIYGYTVPASGFIDPLTSLPVPGNVDPFTGGQLSAAGSVVELGKVGSFDVFNTAWSLFLPPVVTATGTTPAGVGEPFGLRNVQGLFNNISLSSSAIWGAAFYSFARTSDAAYGNYLQQRALDPNFLARIKADPAEQVLVDALSASLATYASTGTPGAAHLWEQMSTAEKALVQNSNYGIQIDVNGSVNLAERYANPFLSVYDYTPRMISQLVDSQAALERVDVASNGAYITDSITYQLADINDEPTKTVSESFQRNLNTLGGDPSLTGWNTLFGQFFDHGLDFIGKGGNTTLQPGLDGVFGTSDDANVSSKIYIPLASTDPLYRAPGTYGPSDPGNTKLSISRATVANPEAAGADGMFRTADDIQSPGADGIYGTADDIKGVANPNYVNHTSPYIDQSQTYGSDDTTTNLLREWVLDPLSGKYVPGLYLFDGHTLANPWTRQNPDGTTSSTFQTLPTLNELRAHLKATGRDDLTWGDLDNLRVRDAKGNVLDIDPNTPGIQAAYTGHTLIADSLPRLDADHLFQSATVAALKSTAGFVDVLSAFDPDHLQRPDGNTDPAGTFISDYINLASGQPTALAASPAGAAIVNEILLRSIGDHYVAGDGRANENFGLTAIHHVWHENHNWQIDNLLNIMSQQQAADPTHTIAHAFQVATGFKDANGNYIDASGGSAIAWDQEKLFQAATLINQGEYQHVAIDQYARGLTPNIPLFIQYDAAVNSDVTLDYSQVAFRFGHSQLRETIDTLDPNGSLTGAVTRYALEQAFLNPSGFAKTGPTEIALGMTRQVSNEIDEIVTPALQQNLLGQATDLAAINIARGRDLGMPTLNNLRRELSAGLTAQLNSLNQKLASHPGDVTLRETIDKTIALQAGLQAYSSWTDFGNAIQHPEALVNFIAAYSFDGNLEKAGLLIKLSEGSILFGDLTSEQQALFTNPVSEGGLGANDPSGLLSDNDFYSNAAFDFLTGADQGYEAIDAWNGGLAEKHVFLGQLGSTFDTIFADQMTRLINGDRFYYLWRFDAGLPLTLDLNDSITTEQFKDVIERNTGATHLTGDVFFYADSHIELSETPRSVASGVARDHKYGDLLLSNASTLLNADGAHIGVASIGSSLGVGDAKNGTVALQTLTIQGTSQSIRQKFILDVRPDTGVNPDGTAAAGFNAHEVIAGTPFNDFLDAGDGDDTEYGDAGDDTLIGNAGADHLYGEAGNDLLYGGTLPDFLDGGIGNDIIHGGDDADVLIGDAGNDRLYGENFTDELHGGAGDDYLDGGAEADVFFGGTGQDVVIGGEGLDTESAQSGDDRMFGGAGPDQLFGGYGDDILNAGSGGQVQSANVDEAIGDFGFNIVSFSDLTIPLNRAADLGYQNVNNLVPQVTPFGQLWVNIQGVEGSQYNDTILGYVANKDLATGALLTVDATLLNNWLIGGGGSDTITSGIGDDVMIGDSVRLDGLIGSYLQDGLGHYLNSNGQITTDQSAYVLQGNGILDWAGASSSKHFVDLLKSVPGFTFGDTVQITADDLVYSHQAMNGAADTALYKGARSNFMISMIVDPSNSTIARSLKIKDQTGAETGVTGDIVLGVENFKFSVQTFSLAQLVAPVITGVSADAGNSASDGITNDNTLILSGTALANSPVQVLRNGTPIGSALANSSGQWIVDSTGTVLADGVYSFSAQVVLEGQTYSSNPYVVKIDTFAPVITINGIGGLDNTVSSLAGDSTVIGKVGADDAGLNVTIKSGSTTLGTVITDGTGNFSYSLTSANIAILGQGAGKSITASATDVAGNLGTSSAITFGIDTVAPVLTISSIGGADGIVSAQAGDNTVLGTTEAGLTVTIKSGTTILGTSVANDAGNFAYILTPADIVSLGQGAGKSLAATATDAAGNLGTSAAKSFAIATIAPPAPNAPVITGFNNVTGTTLTITGSRDGASTVSLFNGNSNTALLGSYTYSGNTWSFATTALSNATLSITAKAAIAGVTSLPSSATTVIAANSAATGASANNSLSATGSSVLVGYGGNDSLVGSSAADALLGGDGSDTLIGGVGNDSLTGGFGNDSLTGGAGADQFVFAGGSVSSLGNDTITDFNVTEGDKIVLSKATFAALTSAVGANSLAATEIGIINVTGALAGITELLTSAAAPIIYNQGTGHLMYNSNRAALGLGNGGVFATLGSATHPATFAANNFAVAA